MTKVLLWVKDTPATELARFTLRDDGTVIATYSDHAMQREHEESGIRSLASGRVRPADGKVFFDSLEIAYARTSFVSVETR